MRLLYRDKPEADDEQTHLGYSDVTLILADGVRIEPAHAAYVVLRLVGKPIGPAPVPTPPYLNLVTGLVYLADASSGRAEQARHRLVDYERKMLPDTTVHPLRSVDGVVYFILDDVRKHVRPASLAIQFRDQDGKRDFVLEPAIP